MIRIIAIPWLGGKCNSPTKNSDLKTMIPAVNDVQLQKSDPDQAADDSGRGPTAMLHRVITDGPERDASAPKARDLNC
ncbi:hypothetical protein GCM10023191_067220 [Actinoallomurus oryzae]|uniref:Uncharacterized protein n=1 Tax=Actinoallomurus oryzae TaxID=502180 RepID=A0ABP8QPI1_9ACTN